MSLATAYATQPQETQPRLEPKNQCVHSVVSSTFFPLLEKKKKKKVATKSGLSPSPHQAIMKWTTGKGRDPLGHSSSRGRLAPSGGKARGWELYSVKEGNDRLHKQQPQHCGRVVLSLQEEGKPRTNLTWFSPHGDCSSIEGCHSLTTH